MHGSSATTTRSITASAPIRARDRPAATRTPRPRYPNPHSARGTAARSLSAVSSLGGFRTPARGASGTLTHRAGIRNPSQERTLAPQQIGYCLITSKARASDDDASPIDPIEPSFLSPLPKPRRSLRGHVDVGAKFCGGHKLDRATAALVPETGRMLSPDQAAELIGRI